ncbi:hypothetical protein L1987_30463 [Smallanthus sonchifolius]|uniref:Uncharacterized protein n=1 Tax=Smallanthus sonchifolius TaxID=185202 RepID=A0ACB9I3N3_9ASTR|nr:hypothetical protein L1987_30463 [Smallanthus sonchifolius]
MWDHRWPGVHYRRGEIARAVIRDFRQQSGELFYEAFKRFKELLRNCPYHGIEKWELIQAFYDGLLPEDDRDVKSTSNGSFFYTHVDDDWDILERMAVIYKRHANSSRRGKSNSSVKSVDYEKQKRLDAMEIQMARLGKPNGKKVANVNQSYLVCDGCEELGHALANCPREQPKPEEVNQLGRDKATATHYHPGLRNHSLLRLSVALAERCQRRLAWIVSCNVWSSVNKAISCKE